MPVCKCPGCQATCRVADHLEGKSIRCPKCQAKIVVPLTSAPRATTPAPGSGKQAVAPGSARRARVAEPTARPSREESAQPFTGTKPRQVRTAVILLTLAGVLKAAVPAVLWSLIWARGVVLDEIGWVLLAGLTAVLGTLAILAFVAAILLSYRNRLGRVLAWVVAVACVPGFPLYTLIAVFLVRALISPGMREYFAARPAGPRTGRRVALVALAGGLGVVALAGAGAWFLLAPKGPARPPEIVQAPAVRLTVEYRQRPVERLVVGAGQVGLCTGSSGGKETPGFDRYDAATGRLLSHTDLTGVPVPQQMALSPDGAYLAVAHLLKEGEGYESAVTVWSLADGKVLRPAWKPYPRAGFAGNLSGLIFLDAGRLLTVTRGGDVAAWDLQGRSRFSTRLEVPGSALGLQEDTYTRQPQNFAWSADRKRLALFNGEGFSRLETDTGAASGKTAALAPSGTAVRGTALDQAGNRLAVCLERAGQEELSVWDFGTNQPAGVFPLRAAVRGESGTTKWTSIALTWWAPGHVLVWNGSLDALVVDVATGQVVRHLVGPPLGKVGFVDASGRLWYELLVTRPAANFLICAVDFPGDDLRRYPGLEQGKYYPRWLLTGNGIETQPAPEEVRKVPHVGPR